MEDATTIAEIFENMENGDPIKVVEGVLINIMSPLQAGQGTLQNGTLEDDEGSQGKITFSDVTINEKTAKGQRIRIESVSGARGRTGLKVKDSEQYGRAIWVTSSAKITYPGGGEHSTHKQAPPPGKATFKRGGQAAPPPKKDTETKAGTTQRGPQRTPEERLGDLADLLAACATHVAAKILPVLVDEKTPHEEVSRMAGALTSTLFIQCDKGGVTAGWTDRSNRPLPRPPEDPAQWRECYINSKGSKLHAKKLSEISKSDLLEIFNYCDSKQLNSPFAECVYRAAIETDVLPKKKDEPEDNVPMDEPDKEQIEVPF